MLVDYESLDDVESFAGIEEDAAIFDPLTRQERKPSDKERLVQRMILILADEYRYPLEVMGRDVSVLVEQDGKRRSRTVDLVVFRPGTPHTLDNAERFVVVQPPTVKVNDAKRGVEALKDLMDAVVSCEFGLWTNGRDVSYLQKKDAPLGSAFIRTLGLPRQWGIAG